MHLMVVEDDGHDDKHYSNGQDHSTSAAQSSSRVNKKFEIVEKEIVVGAGLNLSSSHEQDGTRKRPGHFSEGQIIGFQMFDSDDEEEVDAPYDLHDATGQSSRATERSESSTRKLLCLMLFLIVAWWVAAALVVLEIKAVTQVYKYGWFTTAVVNGFAWAATYIVFLFKNKCRSCTIQPKYLLQDERTGKTEVLVFTWVDARWLFYIGVQDGLAYGSLNQALVYLSVSYRQMIMALGPLIVVVVKQMWSLPPPLTGKIILCCCMLMAGGLFEGMDRVMMQEENDDEDEKSEAKARKQFFGVCLVLFAMLIGANRSAMMQHMFQKRESIMQLDKVTVASRTMGWGALTAFFCSYFYEGPEAIDAFTQEFAIALGICGLLVVVIQTSEMKILQISSMLTLMVLGFAHGVPIIIAGVSIV